MTSTKKKAPMPGKKSGKRVPQHNEPKAKMPKHEGIGKGHATPPASKNSAPTFDRGGFNISTGKMAGGKGKKRSK